MSFGQSHSLLTRMKRHGQISMMLRAPAKRIQGDRVNPNLPVLLADYRLSGIGMIRVARPVAPTPQPASVVQSPRSAPVVMTPVQQVAAPPPPVQRRAPEPMPISAETKPKKTPPPMIDGSITEYAPPVPATDNQLLSIIAAHAHKQASGEPYEKVINPRFAKKDKAKDAPVGKANLRRHLEAKEKIAKQGVDPERLRRRPAVSYVGSAALPKPLKPPVVNVPKPSERAVTPDKEVAIDADPELLEIMDGETVAQPMLAERPDSDEAVVAELGAVSAEQATNSSIDLVLPRRARPTRPS